MMFKLKCSKCGAEWWSRGTVESDTNALVLDDSVVNEGECECGEALEVIDEDADLGDLYE